MSHYPWTKESRTLDKKLSGKKKKKKKNKKKKFFFFLKKKKKKKKKHFSISIVSIWNSFRINFFELCRFVCGFLNLIFNISIKKKKKKKKKKKLVSDDCPKCWSMLWWC